MANLNGKVALVTGATYGVGKGVALELAAAGATVYATGRTISAEAFAEDEQIISESTQFVGRAVAALASDSNVMQKSGRVWVAAALAQEYGFTDVDGRQPRPLTLTDV